MDIVITINPTNNTKPKNTMTTVIHASQLPDLSCSNNTVWKDGDGGDTVISLTIDKELNVTLESSSYDYEVQDWGDDEALSLEDESEMLKEWIVIFPASYVRKKYEPVEMNQPERLWKLSAYHMLKLLGKVE